MPHWTTKDVLVGRMVICYAPCGEEFIGIVLAVDLNSDRIRVRDTETGEILLGGYWEEE